jgi:hypothetical protein
MVSINLHWGAEGLIRAETLNSLQKTVLFFKKEQSRAVTVLSHGKVETSVEV